MSFQRCWSDHFVSWLGGIGYYYLKFSDDITDAVRKSISLDHEQGGEFFYNIEVLPWLNITPNL